MTLKRPRRRFRLGLGLLIASSAGCSQSADVRELPEASKQKLIERKVDVRQRSPKSTAAGSATRVPDNARQQP